MNPFSISSGYGHFTSVLEKRYKQVMIYNEVSNKALCSNSKIRQGTDPQIWQYNNDNDGIIFPIGEFVYSCSKESLK